MKIGDKIRCKMTGVEAVVVGRCEYAFRETDIGIPAIDGHRPFDILWMPEQQAEIIEEAA